MLDETAVIEGERRRLLTQLNDLHPDVTLPDLPKLVEEVEEMLQIELRTSLLRHSELLFNGLRWNEEHYLIGPNLGFYDLRIGPDILCENELVVSLLPRSLEAVIEPVEIGTKIGGYGRFAAIRLLHPKQLGTKALLVLEIGKVILETGYRWTKEKIELLVARQEVALVDELYSYLRAIFPSEHLRKKIWIASVTAGFGFRLLDRDVTLQAYEDIDQHSEIYGYSTNRLVAELLSTRLPREQLLMQIAHKLNQCIDGDIRHARYKQAGSIYASTLEALYGSEAFTIYPIRLTESLSIFALFPTEYREAVEPILNHHKDELSHRCTGVGDRVQRALKLFNPRKRRRFNLQTLNEAIMLQPNIAGLGVNINALLSLLQSPGSRKNEPPRLLPGSDKRDDD